ncbi:hypothetical protein AXE80_06805 [Wenyingzhuangia fucanilytica]|uniref:Imelysin-like domain-containing protein n=1 Tax=Wenyingzhuangia fucanilytica TaxID=1790137 RepID=A0A1B1Y5J3_9FLAO|nr:imelysin family protein [Wenyingzhuangia fucanilytica]ANW96007.1 hypothetical protein AXE80_06805 [Wenyingzhuangia fucanilytica]
MKKTLSILLISTFFYSCVKENNIDGDGYNRESVLTNWVNNLVLPAYADFKIKMNDLEVKSNTFISSPDPNTIGDLQQALFQAQKVWQHVAMFELQGDTRIYMNTYPIDRETSTVPFPNSNEDDTTLESNLEGSISEINQIDFTKSGSIDEQGFAAFDYLINKDDALTKFTSDITKDKYKAYLTKVLNRMIALTNTSKTYWQNNAASIIANNGSNANASFDKMVNDYINYVEQGFRENKIATPSGKRDNLKNAEAVESYYSSEHSKEFFEESFKAINNFYYGISYDGSTTGAGLKTYLDYLNAEVYISNDNKNYKITDFVDIKFTNITTASESLATDFVTQVETDNSKMITMFNNIQEYVFLFKTNIFQALSVNQDYVDSDGD